VLEVADVLRQYGPAYLEQFGARMLPSQRRACEDLRRCRTAALGGHLYQCNECGRAHYSYHSCRNRSCPKCHARDTQVWLEQRQAELLPVPYYHVIFTLPQELRELTRRHQKPMYGLVMQAAAEALLKLTADPHYVGGLVGVMAVLPTWSSTLSYHPHVHCLVTGGGVSPDGQQWRPARADYLVPVRALSQLFRGLVLDRIRRQLPQLTVPPAVRQKDWVVHCKPAVQGTQKVLAYLGRYIHRVALTNSRLVALENGRVTFRYRDSRTGQTKTMTLAAQEFLRRFLQHVLPRGVHKVRYYGLWSPAHRDRLHAWQDRLAPDPAPAAAPEPTRSARPVARELPSPVPPRLCPYCQSGTLVYVRRLPPQGRPPP
jgi:hypothetical protein